MTALFSDDLALTALPSLSTYTVTETTPTLGSGQQCIAKKPNSGPGYVGVIYLHGGFQTETEVNSGQIDVITDKLATSGFPVIAGRIGGSLWGSDAAIAYIDELAAYLVSNLDADNYGKVVIMGTSMGGANGLSWIGNGNQTATACFVGFAPLSYTLDVYGVGVDPLYPLITNSINTAYGSSSAWLAAQPTHDATPLAEAGEYEGLKYRFYYGDADEIVDPANTAYLAGVIGSTGSEKIYPGATHFTTVDEIDEIDVRNYIASCYPPTAPVTLIAED